jgi:hypothetical protein
MSDSWQLDHRLPRLRRLITAAAAADIATSLSAHNKKRDEFTAGQLLLLSETVETLWFKMASSIKVYADQTKLFKSSMYKLKLGTFLKQHAPAMEEKKPGKKGKWDGEKIDKLELDIDEIKKQLKVIAGQKRKYEEIDEDIKTPLQVASN